MHERIRMRSSNSYAEIRQSNEGPRDQNQKCAVLFVIVAALTVCAVTAEAQQPTKIPRIGFLSAAPLSSMSARIDAFRQRLRELGYEEGKNIAIEYRYADGKPDQVAHNAQELVDLKVDVLVTAGATDTRAAKVATSAIPIVMTQDNDPVANGFVTSLARPGGNITGLSSLAPEISGKQLELLKEIVAKLSRVTVFGNSAEPGNEQAKQETEIAARAFAIELKYQDITSAKELDAAFKSARTGRANALMVLRNPVTSAHRKRLLDFSIKSRLPAIYANSEYVDAGGLMFYGPNSTDLWRKAAIYVDKILRGSKPADLPVEQPTKFELIINLKTAKQIGLTIPPNVLARADKVIR